MATEKQFTSALPDFFSAFGQKTSTTGNANIGPAQQVFNAAMQPMDAQLYNNLISSIATTANQQVPGLTQALANATGTRSSTNSPLALAIAQLQADTARAGAEKVLNYNQQNLQTAGNVASNIAQATRGSAVTQRPAVNPLATMALGFGLNQFDKRGGFDRLLSGVFGDSAAVDPAAGIYSMPETFSGFGGVGTDMGVSSPGNLFSGFAESGTDGLYDPGFTDMFSGFDIPDMSGFGDFAGGFGDFMDIGGSFMSDIGLDSIDYSGIGGMDSNPLMFLEDFGFFADGGAITKKPQGHGVLTGRTNATTYATDAASDGRDPNEAIRKIIQAHMIMQAMQPLVQPAPEPNPINFMRYLAPGGFSIFNYADGGVIRNRNNMGGPMQRRGMAAIDATAQVDSIAGNEGINNVMLTNMLQRELARASQAPVGGGDGEGVQRTAFENQMLDLSLSRDAENGYASRNATLGDFGKALMGAVLAATAPQALTLTGPLGITTSPLGLMRSMVVDAMAANKANAVALDAPIGGSSFGGQAGTGVGGMSLAPDGFAGSVTTVNDLLGMPNPANMTTVNLDTPLSDLLGGGGSSVGGASTSTDAGGAVNGPGDGTPADFADGGAIRKSNGMIKGPGHGTSDNIRGKSTVPGAPTIRVSPNEMIIPADTVQYFGEDYFTKLIQASHRPVRR